MHHCIQAFFFCVILMFCATLKSPFWLLPLVKQKVFEGFLYLLVDFLLYITNLVLLGRYCECVLFLGCKGQPQHA